MEAPAHARRLLWAVPLALVLGLGGYFVAPDQWPTGEGRLVVSGTEETLLDVPVEVGGTEPLEFTEGEVVVSLPNGVPVEGLVEIDVRVATPLGDQPAVNIELPDGSDELIPVVRTTDDGDGSSYLARRWPPDNAEVVLALLGVVLVLWVSEVFPLVVTSLAIPVVLVFGDVLPAAAATEPFFDPIIVLFFAGFLMAAAMQRVGLDVLIAATITERAGRGPVTLFAVLLVTAAVGSMFMSNTAAMALLLPIAMAVTAPLDSRTYRKVVVLGMAYAATIGGVGSAIGTPANQLAITYLDEMTGTETTFVEWFAFGLPMVVLFLPVMGLYLWLVAGGRPDSARFGEARRVAAQRRAEAGRLRFDQVQVLVVFGLVLVGWLSQATHGWHPGVVALAGAVALMSIGRLTPADIGGISWPTLLTFGGGLVLGRAMVTTGVADWIVTQLEALTAWPTFWAVLAVATVSLLLTTVASNTAAAATLIPLAVPLAGLIGVDPVLLVMVVAIASSIDFALVIGTPPTMLAYSTRLFTAGEVLRKGSVLDVLGIVLLCTAVVGIWRLLGMV